jgi:hypothetical protein
MKLVDCQARLQKRLLREQEMGVETLAFDYLFPHKSLLLPEVGCFFFYSFIHMCIYCLGHFSPPALFFRNTFSMFSVVLSIQFILNTHVNED